MFLSEVAIFGVYTFLCSLPGWLLALPIIWLVNDLKTWRFWALLALGTGIGPLLMFAVALYTALTSTGFAEFTPEAKNLVFLATAISGLTTLIYLLLLRKPQSICVDKTLTAQ